MNPWDRQWSDGRHRIWHTSQANPDLALPIQGNSLSYANPRDIPHLGEEWEKRFQRELKNLWALTWFDHADPLNARYERSLGTAACGKVPLLPDPHLNHQRMLDTELAALRQRFQADFPHSASTGQNHELRTNQPQRPRHHRTDAARRFDEDYGV